MKRCLWLAVLLCLVPGVLPAVDDYVYFEDIKFTLKGEYEAYGKYFRERDINAYNGNLTGVDVVTGDKLNLQTAETEAWLEHTIRIMPTIAFSDKLKFNFRFDIGDYLWQSDYADRISLVTVKEPRNSFEPGDVVEVKKDYEKIRVKDAYLQMITPVGLFAVGRFKEYRHGVIYGIQLPQLPSWTFALVWNKKMESKLESESVYTDYLHTHFRDYRDRDDVDEYRLVTVWETEDYVPFKSGIQSQQWVDARFGDKNAYANNMELAIAQWMLDYHRGRWHLHAHLGLGYGKINELSISPSGQDMKQLVEKAETLAAGVQYANYEAAPVTVEDLDIVEGKTGGGGFVAWVDIGPVSPEFGAAYTTGGDRYYEIDGFEWDDFEPHGYRTPRYLKSLLLMEIEDKYYYVISNLATQNTVYQTEDDISFHNMTWAKLGTTVRLGSKWELFVQAIGAWRTNTKYYEEDYWDIFPVLYALHNKRYNDAGEVEVPLVFKRKDTTYYEKDIDSFLGVEYDLRLTYKLFDGLDISLLGAYFRPGGFYEDVLTPKPYVVQWVNKETSTPVGAGSFRNILGPLGGAEKFDMEDAWTVQLKVDFKWKNTP